MSFKKITSLTMLLSFVVMSYTGIILFVAPPGRVANWINWKILGLTKTEYSNLHSTMMVLFVIASILHIYYNWRPIKNYLSNRAKQIVIVTKEMVIATLLVTLFVCATLTLTPPFFKLFNMGRGYKRELGE